MIFTKNQDLFRVLVCLAFGIIGLGFAYLSTGMGTFPYSYQLLQFAVYAFIVAEAVAANRGQRSVLMLVITLLCGLAYYAGLLFPETHKDLSPASVISAGFVVCSVSIALYQRKLNTVKLGSIPRLILISVPSLIAAHLFASESVFPYESISFGLSFSIIFGVVPLLLEHVPLALYDWGSLKPDNIFLRLPPFIGALIMLFYYMNYAYSSYYLSVMLNIFILLDNGLNIGYDLIRRRARVA